MLLVNPKADTSNRARMRWPLGDKGHGPIGASLSTLPSNLSIHMLLAADQSPVALTGLLPLPSMLGLLGACSSLGVPSLSLCARPCSRHKGNNSEIK